MASKFVSTLIKAASKGGKKPNYGKIKADLSKKIREGDASKQEVKALQELRKIDTSAERTARIRQSQTKRGSKKKPEENYIDPVTGEITGNPTQKQIEAAIKNAKARKMTNKQRELEALLDERFGETARFQVNRRTKKATGGKLRGMGVALRGGGKVMKR